MGLLGRTGDLLVSLLDQLEGSLEVIVLSRGCGGHGPGCDVSCYNRVDVSSGLQFLRAFYSGERPLVYGAGNGVQARHG